MEYVASEWAVGSTPPQLGAFENRLRVNHNLHGVTDHNAPSVQG
jgi:hypothetical protein